MACLVFGGLMPDGALADEAVPLLANASIADKATTGSSLSSRVAAAPSAEQERDPWQMLRQGEAVLLMRHALAPGTGDPAHFDLADCSTQRNLSQEGRAQAEAIGAAIRDRGISQAVVLSSEWCRCLDTAWLLGLGEVSAMPALNSFFQNRARADEQTQALIDAMQGWLDVPVTDEADVRVLVTHQVNITALTGHWPRSGEMLIVTLDGREAQLLASIRTD